MRHVGDAAARLRTTTQPDTAPQAIIERVLSDSGRLHADPRRARRGATRAPQPPPAAPPATVRDRPGRTVGLSSRAAAPAAGPQTETRSTRPGTVPPCQDGRTAPSRTDVPRPDPAEDRHRPAAPGQTVPRSGRPGPARVDVRPAPRTRRAPDAPRTDRGRRRSSRGRTSPAAEPGTPPAAACGTAARGDDGAAARASRPKAPVDQTRRWRPSGAESSPPAPPRLPPPLPGQTPRTGSATTRRADELRRRSHTAGAPRPGRRRR